MRNGTAWIGRQFVEVGVIMQPDYEGVALIYSGENVELSETIVTVRF
jgi:hypothetical protein